MTSTEDFWFKLFFLVFGLFMLGLLFNVPREIAFEGGKLVLRYYGREKFIQANNVEGILVEHKTTEHISIYPVHIVLKDGKKIILNGVREGSPALVSALEQWLKKYKAE